MNLLQKIALRIKIETHFQMVQKWGIVYPKGQLDVPKYRLKKYLPANPVIIDCGAHVGSDSVEFSRIFPKATIHSFEPVPHVFERLKYNTRKRENIQCHQLALSDRNGESEMYVSSGTSDGSSSLLAPTEHMSHHPEVHFNETVKVKTITLDDWAAQNKIDHVDFLWLDMQGYELHMLKASKKILDTVKAIHTEVNTMELYKGLGLYKDLKQWLENKGFKVELELPDSVDMCNVLFVRK